MDVSVLSRYDWAWPIIGYSITLGFMLGAAALIVRAIFREGR